MIAKLPAEISQHLPAGYEPRQGVWLVLPASDEKRDGIKTVNGWLRAEDWYPQELQGIIWFGDDGIGNFFGWDTETEKAVLWNPEDGAEPWKHGSVSELWQFVLDEYHEIK